MSAPNKSYVTRRGVLTTGSVAGLGLAAGQAAATPALDVSDPGIALQTAARLLGDTAPGSQRVDWVDGVVKGVGAGGRAVPFARFKGQLTTTLEPLADGPGWQRQRHLTGDFFDTAGETPLTEMTNPFTGDRVTIAPLDFRLTDSLAPARLPVLTVQADQLALVDSSDDSAVSDTPLLACTLTAGLGDVHDRSLTAVPCLGSWTLVGPWPAWMDMAESPGHLMIHGTRGGPV